MLQKKYFWRVALLGVLWNGPSYGESSPNATVDKSDYWLLNPVPADQMRDFGSDRPGKTHGSTTVDAGHFQLEADFLNATYDRYSTDGHLRRNYSMINPLFKIGITNGTDLEIGTSFFNNTYDKDFSSDSTTKGSGLGDTFVGTKINLFDNDGGIYALAILPFVKIPTAANNIGNGVAEYTLNIPFTIAPNDLWSFTLEPVVGILKNSNDDNRHGDYSFLVNASRQLFTKDLTASLELASEWSGDHSIRNQYTLDPALQWMATANLQLDMGVYIGLNRAATDYNPYTGVSYRF